MQLFIYWIIVIAAGIALFLLFKLFMRLKTSNKSKETDIENSNVTQTPYEPDIVLKNKELQNKLQQKEEKIFQLTKEKEELMERLSQNMSLQLQKNSTSFENINDPDRPSKIAEQYNEFVLHSWHDAKESCDELCAQLSEITENDKLQFLCEIIMYCWDKAQESMRNIEQSIKPFILNNNQKVNSYEDLPIQLQASIENCLKTYAHRLQMTEAFGPFKPRSGVFSSHTIWKHVKDSKVIQCYINDAYRLTWLMVLQRPQMNLQLTTQWQAGDSVDLWYTSIDASLYDSDKHDIINVYPKLLHSSIVMVKGKVSIIERNTAKLIRDVFLLKPNTNVRSSAVF